jgi:signal peptidase I
LTALLVFLFVKLFLFDIELVNNRDMRATYNYGDVVLIQKVNGSFKTNDVLYFEYPIKDSVDNEKAFLFQRLIGLPGDSIEIKNKVLYINGTQIEEDSTIKKNYFITTRDVKLADTFRIKYHLFEGGEVSNSFDYSYSLTKKKSDVLRRDSLIRKVELKVEKQHSYDETCFPYSPKFAWNMDWYGKIYIPKKHDTLHLDTNTIHLYAGIIKEEKNSLEVKRDSIFVNGAYTAVYITQQDYLFVLGDNRDNAIDSRSWGYLAEKYVVGKIVKRIKRSPEFDQLTIGH